MKNIDQNIKRLSFTLSKGNRPNGTDIEAFNGVVEWINTYKTDVLNNNKLFAKLYILFLNQYIEKFETDIFDPIPQKELSRLLDLPLENYYIAFTKALNDSGRYRLLREKGVKTGKHPKEMTKEDRGKDVKLEDFKDVWDVETVTDNLGLMIVEALKRFS